LIQYSVTTVRGVGSLYRPRALDYNGHNWSVLQPVKHTKAGT
jgi:hypothetical protein